MQHQGLESSAGLSQCQEQAEGRARQERDAGPGPRRALMLLAFILGRARCQLGTQMQGAVKGHFLN